MRPPTKMEESSETSSNDKTSGPSKLNAQAPEFVPRSQSQTTVPGFVYPCFHVVGGDGSQICYFPEHDLLSAQGLCSGLAFVPSSGSRDVLTEDLRQKIVKQVEYQFSTANLACTDYLMKFINKDPEGYVPVSVISSFKKIKPLINNSTDILAAAIRTSTKLVLSSDGKKVKRKHPLTDAEIEDFQSRTVIVENLPENYSHQNLEKIFSVVGSVKNVRICHPPEASSTNSVSSRSVKPDVLVSNKLHALVEYETIAQAEKAIAELNDENWRKGLRVRLLLRRSPRSSKSKKQEFGLADSNHENENTHHAVCDLLEGCCQHLEQAAENTGDENAKRGCGRGWVKCQGHGQAQKLNGSISAQPNSSSHANQSTKPSPPGPRMPDGTRGFTLGRGKPVTSTAS
ncbi:unnamed protein product [Victoria cruziana]